MGVDMDVRVYHLYDITTWYVGQRIVVLFFCPSNTAKSFLSEKMDGREIRSNVDEQMGKLIRAEF